MTFPGGQSAKAQGSSSEYGLKPGLVASHYFRRFTRTHGSSARGQGRGVILPRRTGVAGELGAPA